MLCGGPPASMNQRPRCSVGGIQHRHHAAGDPDHLCWDRWWVERHGRTRTRTEPEKLSDTAEVKRGFAECSGNTTACIHRDR